MNKITLFCFIFTACVNKPFNPRIVTDLVFADGIYKQKINVVYIKDNKKEEQRFNAILKKDNESLSLYCYVGFGISLFKLMDRPGKALEFETNQKEIEKNKDFFLKIYPIIKQIIFLSRSSSDYLNKKFSRELKPEKFLVDIELGTENEFHIPTQIYIKNEKYFTFEVTNTSFENLGGK